MGLKTHEWAKVAYFLTMPTMFLMGWAVAQVARDDINITGRTTAFIMIVACLVVQYLAIKLMIIYLSDLVRQAREGQTLESAKH